MKQVRIRLLSPASVSDDHVRAAEVGLKPFIKFGALLESVNCDEWGAFRGVRHRKSLRAIVSGDVRMDLLTKGILDGFGTTFGIALTPYRMLEPEGERMVVVSSAASYLTCAAVSLDRMEHPGFPRILTAMVRRKAARLFIKGECTGNCLMQATTDFQSFVDRFVIPGLDLCDFCKDKIGDRILRLGY